MSKRAFRITKVYTKTGDKGKTRLAGGQQVWKDNLRVEAYGTVDELNSVIGLVSAVLRGVPEAERLEEDLCWIQNKLFDIGGLLATANNQIFNGMPCISSSDTSRLERVIDERQKDLQPLKEFILPGGGLVGSLFHVARAVSRRAERRCVSLIRKEVIDPHIVIFLNRLSDALFVLARWVALKQGVPERLWQREVISAQRVQGHAGKRRRSPP